MIISRNTVYCLKGSRQELVEMYKPFKDVPGMRIRILTPQTGRMDVLIVEMEWESHTAREAFFKSPPWEASAAADWNKRRLDLIERTESDYYQVVD